MINKLAWCSVVEPRLVWYTLQVLLSCRNSMTTTRRRSFPCQTRREWHSYFLENHNLERESRVCYVHTFSYQLGWVCWEVSLPSTVQEVKTTFSQAILTTRPQTSSKTVANLQHPASQSHWLRAESPYLYRWGVVCGFCCEELLLICTLGWSWVKRVGLSCWYLFRSLILCGSLPSRSSSSWRPASCQVAPLASSLMWKWCGFCCGCFCEENY